MSALQVRYLPYGELQKHRDAIARFGEGLKAINAIARNISCKRFGDLTILTPWPLLLALSSKALIEALRARGLNVCVPSEVGLLEADDADQLRSTLIPHRVERKERPVAAAVG